MICEEDQNWLEIKLKHAIIWYNFKDYKNFESLSLEELHKKIPSELVEKNAYYYLILLKRIYLLESSTPLIVSSLETINNFFTKFPNCIDGVWAIFDKILHREIQRANEKELYDLVKLSMIIDGDAKSMSYYIGISLINRNLMKRTNSLSEYPSYSNYIKLLNDSEKSLEICGAFSIIIQNIFENALEFIKDDFSNYRSRNSIEKLTKIWYILKKIKGMNCFNPQFIKSFIMFLDEFKPIAIEKQLDSIEIDFIEDDSDKSYILKNHLIIDEKEIKRSGCSLNSKKMDSLNIISNIYKGKYKGESVCLKIYQELKENLGNFKSVEDEISMYEKLSSKANENNCFLNYYGTCITNDESKKTIYLVMQYVSGSLNNYMNELEIIELRNKTRAEKKLKKLFLNLLNSFIEMHKMRIFHLDIKPSNILINNDHPYIIDFDVSVSNNEDKTCATEGVDNKYVGTRGYMAPEIQEYFDKKIQKKYFLRQADAFSLGMTFYHLIKKKKFEDDLNKRINEEKLRKGIAEIEYEWAKPLLYGLLDFNCASRINLTEAKALLDGNATQAFNPEIPQRNEFCQLQSKEEPIRIRERLKCYKMPYEKIQKRKFYRIWKKKMLINYHKIIMAIKKKVIKDVRTRVIKSANRKIILCFIRVFKLLKKHTKNSRVVERLRYIFSGKFKFFSKFRARMLNKLRKKAKMFSIAKNYHDIKTNAKLQTFFIDDIRYRGMSIKSKKIENIMTNICEGKIEDKKVFLKTYQIKENEIAFNLAMDKICKTIAYYLQDSKDVCFENIIGFVELFSKKNKTIMIVTPWIESTLKDLIRRVNDWPKVKKEHFIQKTFGSLLRSFYLMHSYGIYHLDISPENILMEKIDSNDETEENWKLYITDIDFNIFEEVIKHNQVGFDYKKFIKNFGYIDPELLNHKNQDNYNSFDKGKADVFSLGMIFLNLVIGDKFKKNLSVDKNLLTIELSMIPVSGIKKLITGMVEFDAKDRMTMSQAYEMFCESNIFEQEI